MRASKVKKRYRMKTKKNLPAPQTNRIKRKLIEAWYNTVVQNFTSCSTIFTLLKNKDIFHNPILCFSVFVCIEIETHKMSRCLLVLKQKGQLSHYTKCFYIVWTFDI